LILIVPCPILLPPDNDDPSNGSVRIHF
jgi:hypothetical protein